MGPDEIKNGTATIKDLDSGVQTSIPLESIVEVLTQKSK